MGVCLNKKFVKNLLLDNKTITENQEQIIIINNFNQEKDKSSNQKNKEQNNEIATVVEKDTIKKSADNNEKNKEGMKTENIINYKIQTKYKTKLFGNFTGDSVNSIFGSKSFHINNENCEKLIYFTNLNDKKVNAGTSTASNSNIK